jgi:cell division protein ZapA
MAQITIDINGKPYVVGCEDGQEAHLTEIAGVFDQQVRQIAGEVGTLTEARLFLMAALMMADDLTDTRNRLLKAQGEAARYATDIHRIEQNSAKALDNAARKIEALVHRAAGSNAPA